MLACSFYPTGLGLGLGFFEEDLDLVLDLTVAGLVTSLLHSLNRSLIHGYHCQSSVVVINSCLLSQC